ncbi:phosphotransferase [Amycolatopsis thermalba]|uniref:Phosphotransferase n=1 Tax=Amycolatopsis thermalba TaxID=944492 RepID=A0ABY4P0V7_9PSEU|nr:MULTISPECIES: phosphotransferase [Amycolatopsis]UQS25974.1 phosphotransferase [Amycolatopsis thermalba]
MGHPIPQAGLADTQILRQRSDRLVAQTGQLAAPRSRDVPGLEELGQRLGQRLPAHQRAALVHGDYRLGNVVVGGDGTITAVLDWEMPPSATR